MRYDQKGFTLVEAFLMLILLAIVGCAGWQVYNTANKSNRLMNEAIAADAAVKSNAGKPVSVVAVGDIACDTADINFSGKDTQLCQDDKTFALIKQLNPDAVLVLGDLQYNDGSYENFVASYDKNWGQIKAKTYPVPGNHEYETENAGGYFKYFAQEQTGKTGQGYYATSLGHWLVVALNSNCKYVGGCDSGGPQATWLESELSKSKASCTLLFWHHPHFTSGKYALDENSKQLTDNFWKILSQHKADIVLNGHDHLYERFGLQDAAGNQDPAGVRQFTVGTGGKSHYKATIKQPNSQKITDDQFGVLKLELYPKAYRWKFISVDNKVLDAGYQHCSE